MLSAPYVCICAYCMLQLGLMSVMENRRRNSRIGQERYFLYMLLIALFSFVANIASSVSQSPAWYLPYAAAGNYVEMILSTFLIPVFFLYCCEQISNLSLIRKREMNIVLWSLASVCAILILSTAFTGQIFFFDEARVYHRGPLFMIPMSLQCLMMILVEIFLVTQRVNIEKQEFRALMLFMVAPLLGWGLQALRYGLPFSLMGVTFAAQVVYTNIQNRNMDKDYLTGAFNRQTLDRYMQHKIDIATSQKSFSAILLDIDNFKAINDSYGHFEGDQALVSAVHLLRMAVNRTDFIARYGGDEFCIILNTDCLQTVQGTIRNIQNSLIGHEQATRKPYALSFSFGYAVFDRAHGNDTAAFLKVIDQLMYKEKNTHRMGEQAEN